MRKLVFVVTLKKEVNKFVNFFYKCGFIHMNKNSFNFLDKRGYILKPMNLDACFYSGLTGHLIPILLDESIKDYKFKLVGEGVR